MLADADALLAGLSLRRLAETYALAADRRDGALMAAQFTEDGVLVAPRGTFTGRAEIATVADVLATHYLKTFHGILGQVPSIERDTAAAETYCIARHFLRDSADRYLCYEMTIRYLDDFALTDKGWRFSRRELVVDATRTFPVEERPR